MPAFKQGDTFYGGGEILPGDHLWIVINDPSQHSGRALYVNITSLKGSFAEITCVLQVGDHPFIRKPSHVRFGGAKTSLITELDQAESMNLIRRHQPASAALVQKIRLAALASPRFKSEYKDLL